MKLSTALIYSCNVLLWAAGHAKEKDKVPASLRKLMDDTNGDDQKVSVVAFLQDRFNTDQVAHIADKNEKAAEGEYPHIAIAIICTKILTYMLIL